MLSNANLQPIILTSRIEAAESFYRETLGLALCKQAEGSLVFDVGGSDLLVSPVETTAPTEHTVMGFSVTDVDDVVERLSERGVAFERFEGFPHDEKGILKTPGGSRVAWFRDPDGNLLSIVEYADSGT